MDKILLVLILILGKYQVKADYSEKARQARSALLNSVDPNVRPSSSMTVSVGFTLVSITELISDRNEMTAVGWFTVTWVDSRIVWDSSGQAFANVTSLYFKEGEIWRPDLKIENAVKEVDIIANDHHRFRALETGNIYWEPAKYMVVHCTQDLTYYPFDKQRCHITLTSWSHDASEVLLLMLSNYIDMTYLEENVEWKLDGETGVFVSNKTSRSDQYVITHSRITFYFTMSRISNLVGLTFIFPLILLSILSVIVFLLPNESGEKATFCAVTFLSIIVYFTWAIGYFPVSKTVPVRVSYIIVVLVLACTSIFCTVVVLWLHHQRGDKQMNEVVMNISNFLSTITFTRKLTEIVHDIKPNENVPETSNSTTERQKQLAPVQNGGGHITTSIDTMERLPPVNDRLRKNKVRPKSGESVYSVNRRKMRHTSGRNWQQLAYSLDRFFLIWFIVKMCIVHFSFIGTLVEGGKNSEP